jgi:hypothetical protein
MIGSQAGSLNGNQRGSMASRALNQRIKRAAKAPAKAKVSPSRAAFLLVNNALKRQNALARKGQKSIPVSKHNRPYVSADIAS